jgi:Ca2+-binding EF-hand superfamily protein
MWNYEMKLLMVLRDFNGTDIEGTKTTKAHSHGKPGCIDFDSTGAMLGIGFATGVIKLLYTETLEDVAVYTPSTDSIQCVKFSSSGSFFAAFDATNHVLIFKRELVKDANGRTPKTGDKSEFTYLGRALAHTAKIIGIEFGYKDIFESLISVSDDRYCVEYDLPACSVSNGIISIRTKDELGSWHSSHKLEVFARPTAIMWHPKSANDPEDRFIMANDEFKMKEFNIQSKHCRKTTLAPRFGSPPTTMVHVPIKSKVADSDAEQAVSKHFAFATSSKVIGIGCFPLTGDPSEVMGVIAHPSTITSIAASFDGRYLFSTGGADLSANMWRIDTSGPINDAKGDDEAKGTYYHNITREHDLQQSGSSTGAEISQSLFSLLEGGQGGELHRDIIDYFCYCQLRNIGEDTTEQRQLSNLIVLEDIPSLMRSVGFYPSEDEALNMINEVRYKRFITTGEVQDHVNLTEFIRLYLNHRPVLPLDKLHITRSFETLASKLAGDPESEISWYDLKHCLVNHGENTSQKDFDDYITALTGAAAGSIADSTEFNSELFAQEILGFEEF